MRMILGKPTGKIKLSVEAVDNGFIVRMRDYGLSALKEPYVKGIFVFNSYSSLADFLEDALRPESEAQ